MNDRDRVEDYAGLLQYLIKMAPRVTDHKYQDLSDMLSHGLRILLTSYKSIKSKHENGS